MKTLFAITLFFLLISQKTYAEAKVIKCTDTEILRIEEKAIINETSTIELHANSTLAGLIDRGAEAQQIVIIEPTGDNNLENILKGALSEKRLGRKVYGFVISREAGATQLQVILVAAENAKATVELVKWNLESGQQSTVVEKSDKTQYSISCKIVSE